LQALIEFFTQNALYLDGNLGGNYKWDHRKSQLCPRGISIDRQLRNWFSDVDITTFAESSGAEDASEFH
jgi:hypothetical protein